MKINFGYFLALSSIAVAGCAAFFSVYGLSQLFAGASLAVIIMASALELTKIVAASFLHKYWTEMSKILKTYLTIGVIVLVTITSAGIYGFLSSAYQKTASHLEIHNGELGILDGKIAQFEAKIEANKQLIDAKSKRVTQLSDLRSNQENRLNSSGRAANAARRDITTSNGEIQTLNTSIDEITNQNNVLLDSIGAYKVKKLELSSNSKVAGEVGPLTYLSKLTGQPMDVVVNYFILLLVFVFDPLAIAMVIATNWVFERDKKKDATKEVLEDIHKVLINPETGEIDLSGGLKFPYEQDIFIGLRNDEDEQPSVETLEDIEKENVDESIEEPEMKTYKHEPVIPTGKVERNDIREIKERERGFSVVVPEAKNKVKVERIGNKVVENGDVNRVTFKKR